MKVGGKKALILGITGQDGAYLTAHLNSLGYDVHGTSRYQSPDMSKLRALGMDQRCSVHTLAQMTKASLENLLETVCPEEIYGLAFQSSVGMSFDMPLETIASIGEYHLLLELLREHSPETRFCFASSSECFGASENERATEKSELRPVSPYGIAKTAISHLVRLYRENYGLYSVSAYLFNHESPLRSPHFVTKKIIQGALEIKRLGGGTLKVGNINVVRDWGWASEYVTAMQLMLETEKPDDYIISTGVPYKLETFISDAFSVLGLNWKDHVKIDASLLRPVDVPWSVGNPKLIERNLGWTANTFGTELVKNLISAEMEQ